MNPSASPEQRRYGFSRVGLPAVDPRGVGRQRGGQRVGDPAACAARRHERAAAGLPTTFAAAAAGVRATASKITGLVGPPTNSAVSGRGRSATGHARASATASRPCDRRAQQQPSRTTVARRGSRCCAHAATIRSKSARGAALSSAIRVRPPDCARIRSATIERRRPIVITGPATAAEPIGRSRSACGAGADELPRARARASRSAAPPPGRPSASVTTRCERVVACLSPIGLRRAPPRCPVAAGGRDGAGRRRARHEATRTTPPLNRHARWGAEVVFFHCPGAHGQTSYLAAGVRHRIANMPLRARALGGGGAMVAALWGSACSIDRAVRDAALMSRIGPRLAKSRNIRDNLAIMFPSRLRKARGAGAGDLGLLGRALRGLRPSRPDHRRAAAHRGRAARPSRRGLPRRPPGGVRGRTPRERRAHRSGRQAGGPERKRDLPARLESGRATDDRAAPE